MRQILTNDFWGLHKNINSAFPVILECKFGDDPLVGAFVCKN